MLGGAANTIGGATGVSSNTQGLLDQLQQAENQALTDMVAITKNQIQFNTQMNDAKAAHTAANSFNINT
jgi:hypothetical protein